MDELQKMLTNSVITLVGILLALKEMYSLVVAIKTIITQRNDALTSALQYMLALLSDIKAALTRLYQLIKSR